MKNTFITVIVLLFMSNITKGQVGINTESPKATLHVEKVSDLKFSDGIIPPRISGDSLTLKASAYGSAQHGAIVYVTSPVTNPGNTEPKTQDVKTKGLYIYDAYYTHPNSTLGIWNHMSSSESTPSSSVYAAKFSGNLSLINISLSLFSSNFNYIPLSSTSGNVNTEIATAQVSNNEYVAPSDGFYHINYSFRIGQGISAEVLSNLPGIAITKTTASTTSLLDYRRFGGINLLNLQLPFPLDAVTIGVNITLTQGQISHIYQLKAGDRLRFVWCRED
ncbi:hypothetical protein [Chryseobacterium echinoideorum]|uniref:hypothetical protein n=1 Tax=Chryseobacterium echinoideorum TaxID=1549648 RepID=UPI0011869F0E|nr:hypothetical protein [Chryseobacterium echinoideorum]